MNVEKYLKIIAKDNSEFSLFKNKIPKIIVKLTKPVV